MSDQRRERPGYLTSKPIEWPEIPWKVPKKDWDQQGFLARQGEKRDFYKHIAETRREEWSDLVTRFEANPTFYNAWHYLNGHPVFWDFFHKDDQGNKVIHEKWLVTNRGMKEVNGLEIEVVRYDPKTKALSDDPARNTKLGFWYEFSMTQWNSDAHVHAYTMDGGADTYEEAVVKAAKHLHRKYGNDRRKLTEQGR
jgi:hypothetical protein